MLSTRTRLYLPGTGVVVGTAVVVSSKTQIQYFTQMEVCNFFINISFSIYSLRKHTYLEQLSFSVYQWSSRLKNIDIDKDEHELEIF